MDRFWSKVDKTDTCWNWTGAKNLTGYGRFWLNGQKSAHRVALQLEGIDIPSGMCVLHKCDNRACVNPAHLFIGTQQDNIADMHQKGRYVNKGQPKGEVHTQAKLCDLDVWLIRELLPTQTQAAIAEWFGVSFGTISKIKIGTRWGHVK